MTLATAARKRLHQAASAVSKWLQRDSFSRAQRPVAGDIVFAVTQCHPTRIVLYTAAFQGGWKVYFMKSLREALQATHFQAPRAVFYDHDAGDPAWDRYCCSFASENIPFVLMAHTQPDETFYTALAAGGYQAWGNPLTSEILVRAVTFAEEMAGFSHLPTAPQIRG